MQAYHAQTDGDPRSTGRLMHAMVETYWQDMTPYASLSLWEIFDKIKNLPFRPDPQDLETLQRPNYTMNMAGLGGDCDDKSIALASYCRMLDIPYKFIAVRRKGMQHLHHVLCQVYIGNQWIHADPTYNFNTLGRAREEYAEYVEI